MILSKTKFLNSSREFKWVEIETEKTGFSNKLHGKS